MVTIAEYLEALPCPEAYYKDCRIDDITVISA